MLSIIKAVYEDGVFKPLEKVSAKEHDKFRITIIPLSGGESSVDHLRKAVEGGSFDFLKEPGEDIYS